MAPVDAVIKAIARDKGFVYTRYADDLTFSSDDLTVARGDVAGLLALVHAELRRIGLMPNREKSVVAPPGARKLVLGLLVDGPSPRLQREFKDRVLLHVHFVLKVGPVAHAKSRGFRSTFALYKHLGGLLSFARQVEPEFAEKVAGLLATVDWAPYAPA
jgi:hypothetical protein